MKKIAFITGATSGIGEATAIVLAKKYNLIICGRRTERLEALKQQLDTEVLTLSFDVRDKQAVADNIKGMPEEWKKVDLLINNAGNAHGMSHIQDGDINDWDAMIDINIKGLLYVSKAILPFMIPRKSGHIINIGSIAGIESYEKGNVYNASKFAVDAISKGMRTDLNELGIKVSEIKPGMVNTEFSEVRFKGDKQKAENVYHGFEPLQAKDIAELIEFMVTRPAHVNLADVLILPLAQSSATKVKKES
ncbi:MAG: 3-hydroxy acid dehydrogenase/malonic semialdehyde reductase [Cyclobacteriaceae bacterium]|jgi:NADP-dependent 3-hydroxy acid dehydrogenase YdfG